MCRRSAFIYLAIFLLFHVREVLAQDSSNLAATLTTYGPVGARIVNKDIVPALNNTFSDQERKLLAKIEWRFPIDANAFNVRAFIDPASRAQVIEISAGHVYLADSLITAGLLALEFNKDDLVADYFLEIVDTVRSNKLAHARGAPEKPTPTFQQFAAIPADAAANYFGSAAFQSSRVLNLKSALAVVVSHEFAHHLFGHTASPPPSAADSRRREAEADAFAAQAADKAGFSAASISPLMGFLASMEGDAASLDVADHPAGVCRQVQFSVAAVPSIASSPALEKLLNQNPGMRPRFNAQIASLPSSNRFVDYCCPENARQKIECWGDGQTRQSSVGYCIPLLTLLRAGPTGFTALKGKVLNASRWSSAVNLLHVNGCHIDTAGSGANLICEEGYMSNAADWQKSYETHRAAIGSCEGFINSTWDVDKKDDDPDGTYVTSFWPDDDQLARVGVAKVRDGQGRLFVRLTFRSQ